MPSILVVDDDRAIQEFLVELLSEAGYEVETCRDGNEVLLQLEVGGYDLLILDLLIPHKNGFTVIEELRAHPALAALPVIMMSGIYRSRNHRNEMLKRFDVVDYLDKPLASKELLRLVRSTIGPGEDRAATLSHAFGAPSVPVSLGEPKTRAVRMATPGGDPRLAGDDAQRERLQVETEQEEAGKSGSIVLQGSVRDQPVATILGRIWREQRSGALLLRRGKIKKIVYVRDGNAYWVKSNLVGECLGQVLVRERLIAEKECVESIARMKKSGRRQGEILVEMGCMTQKNLNFALELQLETKLFEVLAWEEGEYRFNSSAELPSAGAALGYSGAALVVEGIRRTFDETRLRGLMVPHIDVPLRATREPIDLAPLNLTSRERQALEALRLPLSTRELVDLLPIDPPDTLRVLYSLIALELLEYQS